MRLLTSTRAKFDGRVLGLQLDEAGDGELLGTVRAVESARQDQGVPDGQAGLVGDGAGTGDGAADVERPVADHLDRNDRLLDEVARDEDGLDPLAHGVEIDARDLDRVEPRQHDPPVGADLGRIPPELGPAVDRHAQNVPRRDRHSLRRGGAGVELRQKDDQRDAADPATDSRTRNSDTSFPTFQPDTAAVMTRRRTPPNPRRTTRAAA